tara:strand:+ start:133 stop:795 length:663 start_codon:yes stop_codon:yes gene_type:complete
MFVIFYFFDLRDLTDFNFFKDNQQILNDFKSKNIFSLFIFFCIFSIIWITLLGFGMPLALLSGFIFGKWFGTIISAISFSLGATLLYYLANLFLKEIIKEKLSVKMEKFLKLFKKNEFLYFFLFRLTGGGMPFPIQNVIPVIFNMKIKNYFSATLLGLIPGMFVLNSLGSGIGSYINKSDSIEMISLIKDREIYLPILIFILLLIVTFFINKFFLSEKKI